MSSITFASPPNYTDALTALNVLVNDTDNFTFTVDQKNDALNRAWGDGWVVKEVWDSSLTYTDGTWQYTLPSTISVVWGVYIQRESDIYPEEIDDSLWQVINGKLQFLPTTQLAFADTYTLNLHGGYKLAVTDTLDTPELQNYVINLAAQRLLSQLSFMKALRFLRNDTSMADILNLRRQVDADVTYYRLALQRHYIGV